VFGGLFFLCLFVCGCGFILVCVLWGIVVLCGLRGVCLVCSSSVYFVVFFVLDV